MGLLKSFYSSPSSRLIDSLGDSIAERCYPNLSELVSPTILTMTLAEAKGYTRAIMGPPIRCLVDDVVHCYELDQRLCLPLVERVLGVVHSQILADLHTAAPTAVALKRAA